ncbi:MAG: hypothetical protein LBV72_10540 [Tannerella sp.]|jgi:hypothetical protein|nr:hypothetical protein [Tannerella sp.]
MKNYLVLILLLIADILFVSCNKSEVADHVLPIRSELPLYSYTIDSEKFEGKIDNIEELVTADPFIIQSEEELQAFFDKVDELLGTNPLRTLPEYTTFNFLKHTVILKFFFHGYHPSKLRETESYFFSKDYLSDQFKSEGYSYYYSQICSFKAHHLDDDGIFISLSGIVVDKIPNDKKVMGVINFTVSDGWDD